MRKIVLTFVCFTFLFPGTVWSKQDSLTAKSSTIPSLHDRIVNTTEENEELREWIKRKVDSVKLANNVPAISIGIIYKGSLLMQKGFGYYNRKQSRQVDANSIYQIASDTKKMTGIIARNLEKERILDLNAPIVDYFQHFLNEEAKVRLQDITMSDLLLHTSGLPYRQPTMNRKDGEPFLIPYTEKELQHDLNTVVLKSKPGSKFGYSNFGYAIAGYLLEKLSGKSYSELVQQYIAQPYGMVNTTTQLNKAQQDMLVTPYFKSDGFTATAPAIMGKLTPAGGVYSNIADLMVLMRNQMDSYIDLELGNPLVLHENLSNKEDNYGFGLGKKVFEKGTQYGHGGDLDGFASAYVFSPEFESGVIILTSSGGKWVGELEKELFFKMTDRKYKGPKRSLAQEFYTTILDKNYDIAKLWFSQHKNSNDYYLKEEEMNNVGYALLQQDQLENALQVFQLNTVLFPNSSNVYDSLGECNLKMGNKEMAAKNYRKSLDLDPSNDNARRILEKMEKE